MKNDVRHFGVYGLFLTLIIVLATILTACSSTSSSTSPPISTNVPAGGANSQQASSNAGSGSPQNQGTASQSSPNAGSVSSQKQGATGTIAKIENNTLTLTTTQGQITVNVSSSTSIQKTEDGTTNDLQTGIFLTVMGTQSADSTVKATTIMIRPQNESTPSAPPSGMTPSPSGSPVPTSTNNANKPNNTGRGVMGTLSKIDGNTLTLTGTQETTTVSIDNNTKIQKTVTVTLSDLKTGESVTVFGAQDANGNINATSIMTGQLDQINLPGPGGNPSSPPANATPKSN